MALKGESNNQYKENMTRTAYYISQENEIEYNWDKDTTTNSVNITWNLYE